MSTPPRPLSTASPRCSIDSQDSTYEREAPTTALDSSSHLILVHDDSDEPSSPLNFDDDFSDEEDAAFEPQRSITPLSPSSAFLYLLTPYLRMGALYIPQNGLSVQIAIPALFFFAVLSAFTRQIWYLLARYIHKADMESVILDAFARGRGKERQRTFLRGLIRLGTGALRVMLAVIYLRDSVDAALPFLPPKTWFELDLRIPLTVLLAALLLPLCMAQSLASRRIAYTTWTSLATYAAWLGCVAFAHAQGLHVAGPPHNGILWQGIASIAFAFTTSSTLPLYASLKVAAITQSLSTARKTSRSRSFRSTSLLSVAIATAFIFPSCFFSFPSPPEDSDPADAAIQPLIAIFRTITLLGGIPSTIVTSPSLPIPPRIRQSINFSLSTVLIVVLVAAFACLPQVATHVLSDVVLVSALLATYFLPALIHITTHQFKQPLSIVIPSTPLPPQHSTSTPANGDNYEALPSPADDELLQRKERLLQKNQFKKRIVWDVGVWVLLAPVSGGGVVWGVGRLARVW